MFYSYTRRKHKKILVGIIALSSLKSLPHYFLVTEGRYVSMQNKINEKNGQVSKKEKERMKQRDSPYHPLQRPSVL